MPIFPFLCNSSILKKKNLKYKQYLIFSYLRIIAYFLCGKYYSFDTFLRNQLKSSANVISIQANINLCIFIMPLQMYVKLHFIEWS